MPDHEWAQAEALRKLRSDAFALGFILGMVAGGLFLLIFLWPGPTYSERLNELLKLCQPNGGVAWIKSGDAECINGAKFD